jgi:chromosome segregation ATPase
MEDETKASEAAEVTLETLQAQLTALQSEREALLNKNNELLGEAKKAKAARNQAEQAASEEARKKAEAEGNYEQLFKSSESERQKLLEENESIKGATAKEKRDNEALKLASSMAEGANIELLADFIQRRLKYSDGVIKVTDSNGDLTVSSLEDLKTELVASGRYASLLKGNQSSGGGATGGNKSGGAAKIMAQADFDAMTPNDRMKFMKAGGKLE